jgi:hypothetical protein
MVTFRGIGSPTRRLYGLKLPVVVESRGRRRFFYAGLDTGRVVFDWRKRPFVFAAEIGIRGHSRLGRPNDEIRTKATGAEVAENTAL